MALLNQFILHERTNVGQQKTAGVCHRLMKANVSQTLSMKGLIVATA